MTAEFFQARAGFLKANQQRFAEWGEANNHRITGAGLDEFHNLFVVISSYHQRLRWISKPKSVWYRREQLSRAAVERMVDRWSREDDAAEVTLRSVAAK